MSGPAEPWNEFDDMVNVCLNLYDLLFYELLHFASVFFVDSWTIRMHLGDAHGVERSGWTVFMEKSSSRCT